MFLERMGNKHPRLYTVKQFARWRTAGGIKKGTCMPTEPLMIRKSTNDLSLLVASQVAVAGLTEEVENHFLVQKQEIVPALQRVLVLPGTIPLPVVPVELGGYPTEKTDCFEWLRHMEQFAEECFGVTVSLREMFPIPAMVPWEKVLVIFDPGLSFREIVDKALKAQGLSVGEGMDVMKFTGAESAGPRLWIVERTPEPRAARGLPPKFAELWFQGRQTRPLNLGGYGIGTGLLYKVEKKFLDPEAKTVSWFPENIFLPGGGVAYGRSHPDYRKVWFARGDPSCEGAYYGFREAILLLPQS